MLKGLGGPAGRCWWSGMVAPEGTFGRSRSAQSKLRWGPAVGSWGRVTLFPRPPRRTPGAGRPDPSPPTCQPFPYQTLSLGEGGLRRGLEPPGFFFGEAPAAVFTLPLVRPGCAAPRGGRLRCTRQSPGFLPTLGPRPPLVSDKAPLPAHLLPGPHAGWADLCGFYSGVPRGLPTLGGPSCLGPPLYSDPLSEGPGLRPGVTGGPEGEAQPESMRPRRDEARGPGGWLEPLVTDGGVIAASRAQRV